MELKNNTILITGGSSGVGLELARRLIQNDNQVIICGRSKQKLDRAKQAIPQVDIYQCDISKTDECKRMAQWVQENHKTCNILINNAAIVHTSNFYMEKDVLGQARDEIDTNLFAPIALSKLFIPIIEKNANSHIVNITTGLIYAPKADYPFYNATKAALHSFTQVLRMHLVESPVTVREIMLPAVDTPWHNGNPPKIAIPVDKAVDEMLQGLESKKDEVKVAGVKLLYKISRIAPRFAVKKINSF